MSGAGDTREGENPRIFRDDTVRDDLERWESRWRDRADLELPPTAWLVDHLDALPTAGRALDWAGGDGRHALLLAERGLDVTLVDIAPTALATAARRAGARGISLDPVAVDLAHDDPPPGPYAVVLCAHHLDRSMPARASGLLAPGGLLVWIQPTVRNLERHSRPPRDFCLAEGELATLLDRPEFEVVILEEGWGSEGRHEACGIARRAE